MPGFKKPPSFLFLAKYIGVSSNFCSESKTECDLVYQLNNPKMGGRERPKKNVQSVVVATDHTCESKPRERLFELPLLIATVLSG